MRSILTEDGSEEIVRAIVGLAKSLNLRSIAEGVEQDGQLRALQELGCDHAQGFLFVAPSAPDEIEPLLASWDTAVTVAAR